MKSHVFHVNIEAGIEHVCNISNRNFQKFPLAFRAGQFVDDTFYCRQFDLYNVETIIMAVTKVKETLGLKVMTVTVIRVMYTCTMYIHITMLPENGEPAYRINV